MIDWISAEVPFPHDEPIFAGVKCAFDDSGAHLWTMEQFALAEGSFDSRSTVQSVHGTEQAHAHLIRTKFQTVRISGNPAKFMQGHNLFGSDNLTELAPRYFYEVLRAIGREPDEFTLRRWLQGDYKLDRVDVAQMIDVGGPAEVQETLTALAQNSHVAYRGRATVQHGTCQWGKRSARRVCLKAYDKSRELKAGKKHRLHPYLPMRDRLTQLAIGTVRIEAEFHARFLDAQNLRHGSAWHSDTAGLLWSEQIEAITMSTNVTLHPSAIRTMPATYRRTYAAWASGYDVQALELMARKTFYRHRKFLLAYGIDIAVPPTDREKPRTVSLHSVITGRIAKVPDWAMNHPQLYRAA